MEGASCPANSLNTGVVNDDKEFCQAKHGWLVSDLETTCKLGHSVASRNDERQRGLPGA